ncbi:MaoC family dehydratase [Ensifer sp. ENS10]|uniref:MaoC family dehydratase n=1 Tax=unclassified Ensifer TaxID=2633371 RepID=UPI00070CD9DB|nr:MULTISPECIES: MaoC family dehydratase [unclassified Ensifer]KRD63759.1 dehydratase [Ensifer sp. Root278]MBD9508753.1 MaoC family dehydratase [Ensifer sp. ENS10]MBV7517756.1 MaoC family dehydratase [Ensifer sp. ENS12]
MSNSTPGRLFLDDLYVGQRFTSGTHTIDAAQIKAFALQFDPQPFHIDEARAKDTLFGGLAASGWHTAAITMRLNVETGLPFAGGLIGAGGEINWPAPTRPGDTLHVESEVLEIIPSRSKPDRGIAVVLSSTINQHGEVVQNLKAKLVLQRKAAG